MWKLQPRLGDLRVSVEEEIEIQRPRPLGGAVVRPRPKARSMSRRLSSSRGPGAGLELNHTTEKPRLVEVADRPVLRSVERAMTPRLGKRAVADRGAQCAVAVAEVEPRPTNARARFERTSRVR